MPHTEGPWSIDERGDIVSGPRNVAILYACKPEDKRILAQAPELLERANSYSDAFYQLGKLLGIPAQDKSPSEVWATQMLPKLRDLIQDRADFLKTLQDILDAPMIDHSDSRRSKDGIAQAAIAKVAQPPAPRG